MAERKLWRSFLFSQENNSKMLSGQKDSVEDENVKDHNNGSFIQNGHHNAKDNSGEG